MLDDFEMMRSKRTKKAVKPKKNNVEAKYIPPRAVLTSVKLGESITVKNLAETLKKTATEVIKKLMAFGVMATLNHEVDYDTAAIIAEEFGIKAEKEVVVNEEDILLTTR
jgi:translation initiation factor IF-2